MSKGKVVIVGGGIIGSGVAYHLHEAGWTDITVIDKGPLPYNEGSTSHAPGGVGVASHSQTLTRMAKYSSDLYGTFEPHDHKHLPFDRRGGIELARTTERMDDLRRVSGKCAGWGIETHMLSPAETVEKMPFLDPAAIAGSMFVADSALIKGYHGVAHFLNKSEAVWHEQTELVDILTHDGRVSGVRTNNPEIETISCDHLVIAANIWTPAIRGAFGYQVPLMAFQHQYAITTPRPEWEGTYDPEELSDEASFPLLRDMDAAMYFRKHWTKLGIGSYHHAPAAVPAHEVGQSAMRPFTPNDFREAWKLAQQVIPMIRDQEPDFELSFNGMFAFSVDGMPVIGESKTIKGMWSANAGWITHAGGIAKSLVEWMTTGETEWDMRQCHLYRFQDFMTSPTYVERITSKNYREIYDIVHPSQPNSDPRDVRHTPFHARHLESGAVFGTFAGLELPNWFAPNADLVDEYEGRIPTRSGYDAAFWSPIVGAEHLAVRDRAGLFDVSGLSIIEVEGAGAAEYANRLCSNQMDTTVCQVTYTCWLTPSGGVKRDLAVARMDADRFWMFVGEGTLPQDLAWAEQHCPDNVTVRDVSPSYGGLGLFGPQARDILARATTTALSDEAFPFYTGQWIDVGMAKVFAMRISYVGELGWELHIPTESALHVYDTLRAAGHDSGMILAGSSCMDSLRLEKGYRLWGADVHTEYTPFEAGLGWTVHLEKDDFLGKLSAAEAKTVSPAKKLTCLVASDPQAVVWPYEPVFHDGLAVGNVTTSNHGYSIGATIAYAYLPQDLRGIGTELTIGFRRFSAFVAVEPLFDRNMTRMKT